jgi:hypothetical protein
MLDPTRDNGRVADASLPLAVRRVSVDEEDAVAVIDQLRAVRKQEGLEPGVVAGRRFRRRGVGMIGWIVHVDLKWLALRDSNPRLADYEPAVLTS